MSFPNSSSGAVSGASVHLSMCVLVAMLVPALFSAATILVCGPAPLEHGLVCGLALVGLGPRQCAATPPLPFAAPVGIEMVPGTPGDGVVCEVATVAMVFFPGIFMMFEWCAAMVSVFDGHVLMNNGDALVVSYSWLNCDEKVPACGSCDCWYLCGDDSCSTFRSLQALKLLVVFACVYVNSSRVCVLLLEEDGSSQDSSIAALHLLVVVAFSFCFQPLRFQSFVFLTLFLRFSGNEIVSVVTFPLLLVPGLSEHVAHVWKGKLAKDESEEYVSLLNSGAIRFQVPSCGILDGRLFAPGVREFWKERHLSIIDNDDRDAVVEISESKFFAAAASGTCWSQPEKLEAVQSGQVIQFFIKGVRGARTQVVRGESQDSLGLVAGVIGMDVYAMVGGKVVDHSLSLECIGIVPDCTVSFFFRLRGGSRDNVPGQWTCSNCQAERCWPVRVKCYRCGAPRSADPIPFTEKKGKGPKGPLGRAPPRGPSSVPPTTSSKPHVVPPRGSGPPGAGVGDPPPPTPPAAAPPSEEMVKALLLLQNVMSKEDFSKYEKLVLPPPKKEEKKTLREEELWRRCQTEERLKKQVQMHLEQIKKHEHNLEQQKIMLADVQMQLESVSLEVKALRALVAETREPEGPSLIAPLPAPRDPPPGDDDTNVPGFDLDMEPTPLDSDDDEMVDRNAGTWLTVASDRKKRGKSPVLMKLKGSPASVRKGSLRQSFVDKTCIFEDELSGVEVGKALLKLSPHGFRDMLSSLPPHAFHQFMNFQPDVPLLHELKSSSSSSGSAEGNGPEEFCG